jgi:hypothetical protein
MNSDDYAALQAYQNGVEVNGIYSNPTRRILGNKNSKNYQLGRQILSREEDNQQDINKILYNKRVSMMRPIAKQEQQRIYREFPQINDELKNMPEGHEKEKKAKERSYLYNKYLTLGRILDKTSFSNKRHKSQFSRRIKKTKKSRKTYRKTSRKTRKSKRTVQKNLEH